MWQETREWVREVENGSFTPLVFSSIGGMGVEASTFFKRMAELIASKTGKNCSEVMHVICCQLSFSLLWSAVLALEAANQQNVSP